MARGTAAYVDILDSDGTTENVYEVGITFVRTTERKDSSGRRIKGYLLEPSGTNKVLRSYQLNTTPWNVNGTATVTEGTSETSDPLGLSDACLVSTALIGTNDVDQTITSAGTDGQNLQNGFWIKRKSTDGTFVVKNKADNSRGDWDIDLSALPDRWVRITRQSPYISVNSEFTVSAAGNGGLQFGMKTAITREVYIWNAHQEVNNEVVSSDITTTTSATSRSVDSDIELDCSGVFDDVGKQGSVTFDILMQNFANASVHDLILLSDGGSTADDIQVSILPNGVLLGRIDATGGTRRDVNCAGSNVTDGDVHSVCISWIPGRMVVKIDGDVYENTSIVSADVPDEIDLFEIKRSTYPSVVGNVRLYKRAIRI